MVDMETRTRWKFPRNTRAHEYSHRIDAHIDALRTKAQPPDIDYFLLRTDRPLDDAHARIFTWSGKGRM